MLFRQLRMGQGGTPFHVYKFRSMRVHAEHDGKVTQATRDDSRITPIGRLMRRTSLDELPQFFNVLRGEMSVAGPRPHAMSHRELYFRRLPGYLHRHSMKPGITGWVQVLVYRGETDSDEKMAQRVALDLQYLRHWSFWLDLKIVAWAAVHGWTNSNAYLLPSSAGRHRSATHDGRWQR
jgi:putative colanic acid biosynthesis UDP-glucose lipid carrier transferase